MSRILNLKNTKFSNPTGLADKANKSNCVDLGKLVAAANKKQIIQ